MVASLQAKMCTCILKQYHSVESREFCWIVLPLFWSPSVNTMGFIVCKLKVCRLSVMRRVCPVEKLTISPRPECITTFHSCVHEILALNLDRRKKSTTYFFAALFNIIIEDKYRPQVPPIILHALFSFSCVLHVPRISLPVISSSS